MMVEFSIVPVSDSRHLSEPIARALKIVHTSGVEYRLTPMGTLLRGEWDEVMAVIKQCHETLRQDFDRVITNIKIDDVLERPAFDDKIDSVEQKSGLKLNK